MGRLIVVLSVFLTSCAAIPPDMLMTTGELLIEFCEFESNKYHVHCMKHEKD